MMNYRLVLQHALITVLAIAAGACNSESEEAAIDLEVTSPTSLSEIDTTDTTVSLAGKASSDEGILQVSWVNDRGSEGIADGTESWYTTAIPLELGDNTVTISAEDAVGQSTSKSIVIKRESGENGSVILSWDAPTAREDGSPLTNLAGYKIYYGRMSETYDYEIDIEGPGVASYVVENLVPGEWYFALAAYDSEGMESDRSNEILRELL